MESTAALLRVLVAEKHRTVAQGLSHLVEALGNAEVSALVHDPADLAEVAAKLNPDIAIVDLEMSPDCSIVSAMHLSCPDTRIIVLADRMHSDASTLVNALASGAVGAIYKEQSLEDLTRALNFSNANAPVVAEEATGLLLSSYLDSMAEKRLRDKATIEALAAAVEVRDLATGRHLHRVGEIARRLLEVLDHELAQNEEVQYGFMLHDVGKIGIPDAVLNKTGPLDDGEWEVMRRHPEMGVKIVQPIGFSTAATDVILHHHERWDGTGYPLRLRGDEIPLAARTFAVADSYDAMTSDRPYRAALDHKRAVAAIAAGAGSQYDPDVAQAFIDLTD